MKRLLFVLLAACLVAGISSDEAAQKASAYLLDEPATSLSSPLEVGVASYWVFYNPIYSSSAAKIIVAVEDESGDLVYDAEKLSSIAAEAYDYSVIEEYLKAQGYSFAQLSPALNSAVLTLQKNQASLYEIESKTITAYPDISFEELSSSLEELLEQTDETAILASEGEAQQRIFESDYTSSSLDQLYRYYGSEMDALGTLFDAYDSFSNELTELQSRVYSTVPDPDNKNLYEALDALRDVGLTQLYSKFRSSNPRSTLSVLQGRKENWVKDSVASFTYRRNRIDSTALYSVEIQRFNVVEASKAVLYECGLKEEVKELEVIWSDVEYYKQKNNEFGYAKMNELLPQATEKLDYIYSKQAKCTAPPAVPSDDEELDLTPLAYVFALALLGYAAYKYYEKKQLEKMMEES